MAPHTTTTVTNDHISKGTIHLSKKSFDFPKCQFSPLLFPYEVRYVYRPRTLTTSSGYSSLQTPLYLCDAHVNKLVYSSLAHLFFCQSILQGPRWRTKECRGKRSFPFPHNSKGTSCSTQALLPDSKTKRNRPQAAKQKQPPIPFSTSYHLSLQTSGNCGISDRQVTPQPPQMGSQRSSFYLQHPTSWGCPGISLPHRRLCSDL